MGQFLRDQRIRNLKIDGTALDRLNDLFLARVQAHNANVSDPAKRVVYFYVIRFDEKGYRFTDFAEVKKHYQEADYVERVIFTMDTAENRSTSGLFGTSLELRIDAKDQNSCWLTVSADNKDWVDATYSGINDILLRQKSFSGYIRNQWIGLLVQVVGIVIGFLISLWAAAQIAPSLKLENAFVVAFFFSLLIYSNIWGYINAQIVRLLDFAFPNIGFKRTGKDALHWFVQAMVGGLIVTLAAFVLDRLFGLAGKVLSSFVK